MAPIGYLTTLVGIEASCSHLESVFSVIGNILGHIDKRKSPYNDGSSGLRPGNMSICLSTLNIDFME